METVFPIASHATFSEVAHLMEAFSTVSVPGIWLTGVERQQLGQKMVIQGAARSLYSTHIPHFIQLLAHHKAFSQYHFSQIQVDSVDKPEGKIRFQVTVQKKGMTGRQPA